MTDHRLTRVRGLLAREGLDAEARAYGTDADILAVHTGPEAREVLARLAPDIRALGFRYVTIEMDAVDPLNPGNP